MTNHLLLFTIGPVQSFIAQARKTQDLFAGSQLLSNLLKTAMDELEKSYPNVDFIFPKPQEGKDISYPNRFIASIEGANESDLEKLGNSLKEKVITTFKNKFYVDAAREAGITIEQKDCYCKQLNGFLDINWVILPYEENDYQTKYKEIERTLGAVKSVRTFTQLEERGRKCSLCGERNVLFYHPTKGKNGNDKKPAHIQEDAIPIKNNKLTSGEGLCAVCFTKRFYTPRHPEQSEGFQTTDSSATPQNDRSFPSTAGIALMDSLKKLDSNLLSQYKDFFKGYTFDEQLYFDENLSDSYFKKNGLVGLKDKLPDIKKKNEEIKKAAKSKDLKLNKYYAIIALDGDNMGKWLSGSEEFLKPGTDLLKFQKDLSQNLGNYAKKANDIIAEPKGKLVYSGGDDVLAFVNLNHLTDVLKDLRTNFPKFGGTKESSASCGVAIAHYKIPLGEVLKRARKMEKAAKEKGDRNAFGIAVLKHSGEIEETVFKWNFDLPEKCNRYEGCNGVNTICLLSELIDYLKKEEFSNTFIKSLNIELYKLMDNEGKIDNPKADDIINIELQRLLERSRDKNKDITKEQAKQLAERIYKLYESKSDDVQNFLSFLNIADFLHREVNK